jgi:hypothetical protein
MTKRFLSLATTGALLGLVGCGTPVTPPADGSTPMGDSSTPTDGGGGTERTLTYVISALTVDMTPPDSNTAVAGFNLDGIHTDMDGTTPRSCNKPDQPSALDQDQNCPMASLTAADGRCAAMNPGCAPGGTCRGGVDNQLPGILDAIETAASAQFPMGLRPELSSQVSGNKISLIVRITGVNDLTNDPSVQVKIYNAYPTFTDNCNTVAPDREYAVAADSVTGGNIEMPTIPSFNGSIRAGRLFVEQPGMFPLPLPEIMGQRVDLTLTNAQLRVNLTEEAGARGNLGGSFNGSQLFTLIGRIAPDFAMEAVTIIAGFVDIEQPLPTPGSMPGVCSNRMVMPPVFGNIGVGLGFSLVRARVAAAPVAARGAGVCGASAATDAGAPRG